MCDLYDALLDLSVVGDARTDTYIFIAFSVHQKM